MFPSSAKKRQNYNLLAVRQIRFNRWTNPVSVLICDAASKTFASIFLCCQDVFLMACGLKGRVKTGWLETMQDDKHRGQYFVLFFLLHKNKAPTHWHARTNTKWFLSSFPAVLFFPLPSLTFWLTVHRGVDCIPTRQSRSAVCQQGTLEKKGIVGEKGARFRHHWRWEGGSRLFMLLLDVFTSQPHVRLCEP